MDTRYDDDFGIPGVLTELRDVPWQVGEWTHLPVGVVESEGGLTVEAEEGSDAWRRTSYGFIHDSEHGLMAPFRHGTAVEVTFRADFSQQFDQAGVFVQVSDTRWVKAGCEFADGQIQLGGVVTDEFSDWSVAPVPEAGGREVTIRVSWADDALTVRARIGDEPFRLVRVIPFAPDLVAKAGPYLCAPTRSGLHVTFTRWQVGPADAALH
ncbi:MAG: DUF1349 domain-containing protein [Cellulomonadaceae bacterium]|nr:DUF1349 domain-containing protein [Cellulomonadaceae bacterium]